MTTHQIDETLARLSDAERTGDAVALDELLTEDFELVGPLGAPPPGDPTGSRSGDPR